MMTERLSLRKSQISFLKSLVLIGFMTFVLAKSQGGGQAFAFSKKAAAPQGTPSVTDSSSLIWVTRKDGATSCGTVQGQSLEEGAAELQKQGVKVLNSRKGNDGKMHALSCGMPTGSLNAYQISRDDLPKALTLGFQEEAKH